MRSKMTRILIADDDTDLVEGLRWYMEAEGYEVFTAHDGEAAIEVFRKEQPDLVILDIMMPKVDGVKACEIIRSESDAYILMLSARDGEIDKVRSLKQGADDYVTKPFHVSELLARVQAILRRSRIAEPSAATAAPTYKWKGLELFMEERRVMVDGTEIELTTMEFDLLAAFMRRPRFVFTRDQLIENIWGDEFYGETRLVDNHIYRLRDKMIKAGMTNFPIVTVRGVGYAFRPED
jgi:DNA-binding response OmpR family regulator